MTNLLTEYDTDDDNEFEEGTPEAYLADGWHVAVSFGEGFDPNDPRSFTNDDEAAQACVDWLEANTDGGIVHVPQKDPGGNPTTITSGVTPADDNAVPIGYHLHGGAAQGIPSTEIRSTITNGDPMFRISGDTGNTNTVVAPFIAEGGVDLQDNDCGLIHYEDAAGWVYLDEVANADGDLFKADGDSYQGMLFGRNLSTGNGGTGRCIVFEGQDTSNDTGSDWFVHANCTGPQTPDVNLRIKDGFGRMRVAGIYERAEGRANIDITGSEVYILPNTLAIFGESSAHGIYLDDSSGVINPALAHNNNGDGIKIGSNAHVGRVGLTTRFPGGNTGDDLNVAATPGGSDILTIPHPDVMEGSVTLPSAPWNNLYTHAGESLDRTVTQTISSNSREQLSKFLSSDYIRHEVKYNGGNVASDAAVQLQVGVDEGQDDTAIWAEEVLANINIDIDVQVWSHAHNFS